MKVRLTREAEADLEEIGDRIAERNPVRAITYIRELGSALIVSASSPMPALRGRNGVRASA
jgi:plasmid stabilization system protein ParE